RCPILRFKETLVKGRLANEKELTAIDAEIQALVDDAQKFAESSPWPDPATATTHVFHSPLTTHHSRLTHQAEREITFVQATHEALAEEMERQPGIFVLGEGIGKRGGNYRTTAGLYDKYGPQRLCDTPISTPGF